jgi:hypothetical protein
MGILKEGNRGYDKLMKTILSAGFAGAAFLLVMREWRSDRDAERLMRQTQHVEMLKAMHDQHAEDVVERRQDRCVNAQLVDTVRAAIWKERPRPRQECP